jgi:hypothetical protein
MSDRFKRHIPKPAWSASRTGSKAAAGRKAGDTAGRAVVKNEGEKPEEIGGPGGPEPTRYGDWEINGRCVDF